MKRWVVLTMVSMLIVGAVGCRQCNWFGRSSEPAVVPVYGGVVAPTAAYVAPAMPGACAPGCTSCGTTPSVVPSVSNYAPVPAPVPGT